METDGKTMEDCYGIVEIQGHLGFDSQAISSTGTYLKHTLVNLVLSILIVKLECPRLSSNQGNAHSQTSVL